MRGSVVLTMAFTALAILAGTASLSDFLRPRADLPISIKVKGVDSLSVKKGVEQVRAARRVVHIYLRFASNLPPPSLSLCVLRFTRYRSPLCDPSHRQAQLNIELHADLRPEFTWNTKQLYVYVVAEYATETSPHNEMVLWNRIIEDREDAKLDIRRLPKMYPFTFASEMNAGKGLLGLEYNISLAWNVMPKVGRLYTRKESATGFRLPEYHM